MGAWGTLCAKSRAWSALKKDQQSLTRHEKPSSMSRYVPGVHMCSCSQQGRTRVQCSRLWCCNLLWVPIPELQQLIPSSVLPVPPNPPEEAGAPNWWWQHLITVTASTAQPRNHHNGTEQSIPEPCSSDTSREVIIQAQWYNSIFIPVRRCFAARGPACILEISHECQVWAIPSPCEITSQGWTIPRRGCFKPCNKELCCPPK